MRFFGADFAGGLPDGDEQRRVDDYFDRHLPSLAPRLPKGLIELLEGQARGDLRLSTHDGRISAISSSCRTAQLDLSICVGDLSVGYHSLTLRFMGVEELPTVLSALRGATECRAEALYDEVDLTATGAPAFRLLFTHSDSPIEIVFRDFSYCLRPLSSRFDPSQDHVAFLSLP